MEAREQIENISISAERADVQDTLDWKQLRAIVTLQLRQNLRSGSDSITKVKGSPVKQLIFGFGSISFFSSMSARYCADLESFLIILFTSSFTYVALSVLPDTYESRQRNIDLLHSKPVSEKTLLASRAIVLFFYAALMVTLLASIPLLVARVAFNCSVMLVVGTYLMLLLGSFSMISLWLTAVLLAAIRFSLEKIRMLSQFILLIAVVSMTFLSMGFDLISESRIVSLTSMSGVKWLPSTWFATFLTSEFDASANLQRLAVVLTVIVAGWVILTSSVGKRYPILLDKLDSATDQEARSPLSLRFLVLLRRVPLVGRLMVSDQSFAVASLILSATQREETSRVKLFLPRVLMVVFLIVSVVTKDSFISAFLMTYFSFTAVIEGIDIIRHNPYASASWIFRALPVSDREILRGMRLAVWLKCYLLPGYLMMIAFFLVHPADVAGAMVILNFVQASILISTLIAIAPALPLSREQPLTLGLMTPLISLVSSLVNSIGFGVLTFSFSISPLIGWVIASVGLAALAATSYALNSLAASRLSALEIG